MPSSKLRVSVFDYQPFCLRCGAKLERGDRNCPQCGEPVGAQPPAQEQSPSASQSVVLAQLACFKRCPACNRLNPPDSSFCEECGGKLPPLQEEEPVAIEEEPAAVKEPAIQAESPEAATAAIEVPLATRVEAPISKAEAELPPVTHEVEAQAHEEEPVAIEKEPAAIKEPVIQVEREPKPEVATLGIEPPIATKPEASVSQLEPSLAGVVRDWNARIAAGRRALAGGDLDRAEESLLTVVCEAEASETLDERVGVALSHLAAVYVARNMPSKAEPLCQRAQAILSWFLPTEHMDSAEGRHVLATVYLAQRRYAEAENLLRQVLTVFEKELKPGAPRMAEVLSDLALSCTAIGKYMEATELLERSVAILVQAQSPVWPLLGPATRSLKVLYQTLQMKDKAAALDQQFSGMLTG